MTKTKSQKMRAHAARNANVKSVVAVPVAQRQRGKKKRWEFNLIKTGDVSANYQNTVGNVGKSMIPAKPPRRARDISAQPGLKMGDQTQDEFVAFVNGSTSFATTTFVLQPGIAATFPWLSKVAKLYERYTVDSMEFYFRPTVSPYANAGQVGKVVLAADYDSSSGAPETIQAAETTDPHVDGMPYENIYLKLDPRRATPDGKFVRDRFIPGTDVKTYDAGNVYVCVTGTANTDQIGELRVRYHVRFFNPKLSETAMRPCNCASVFYIPTDTVQTSGSILTGWSTGTNPLGITQTGGVFTMQPGTYLIDFHGSYAASAGFLLQNTQVGPWYTDAGIAVPAGACNNDLNAVTAATLSNSFRALVHLSIETRIQVNVFAITGGGLRTFSQNSITFHMI